MTTRKNSVGRFGAAAKASKAKNGGWWLLRDALARFFSLLPESVEFIGRHLRTASLAPVIVCLILSAKAATADSGIAARYPGDKNIGNDPAVILADDFESYTSPNELRNKWDNVGMLPNLRIATDTGNYYAGGKALEMTLPISTTEVFKSVGKKLNPTQDVLFIRAYTKFDPGYYVRGGSNHNGLRVSAGNIITGRAPPADGTGFFLTSIQNNVEGNALSGEVEPGYSHIYAY